MGLVNIPTFIGKGGSSMDVLHNTQLPTASQLDMDSTVARDPARGP